MSFPNSETAKLFGLLLDGHTRVDLIDALLREKPEKEVEAILATISDHCATIAAESRPVITGFCMEATRTLYRKFLEVGDFAGALKAIKQLADIAGIKDKRPTTSIDFEL